MDEVIKAAKALSQWGRYEKSWNWAVGRIPTYLLQRLEAKDIASLVDAFMRCYADGWARM